MVALTFMVERSNRIDKLDGIWGSKAIGLTASGDTIYGYQLPYILTCFDYKVDVFITEFENNVRQESKATQYAIVDLLRKACKERFPSRLTKFMNETLKDNIWMRLAIHSDHVSQDVSDMYPLGKYEEIYVETNDLQTLDKLVMYVYSADPYSLETFSLTILHGESVFERTVNNSKRTYHVYNKLAVENIVEQAKIWKTRLSQRRPNQPSILCCEPNEERDAISLLLDGK